MQVRDLGMRHAMKIWSWCNLAPSQSAPVHVLVDQLSWRKPMQKWSNQGHCSQVLLSVLAGYSGCNQLVLYTALSDAKISLLEWNTFTWSVEEPEQAHGKSSKVIKKGKSLSTLWRTYCWWVGKYSGEVPVWACSSLIMHWVLLCIGIILKRALL